MYSQVKIVSVWSFLLMSPSAKNLSFLTKTSLSLKICTRVAHACCFTSTFYTHYIFICLLFSKSLLIKSYCQYNKTSMCDHLPYAATWIRQNTHSLTHLVARRRATTRSFHSLLSAISEQSHLLQMHQYPSSECQYR